MNTQEMNLKPWSQTQAKKYNWLYNYMNKNYTNVERLTYILDYKTTLINIIDSSKWSDSSKEGLFFMISRYLYNNDNNDPYIKIYSQKGFNISRIIEKKEGANIQNNNELINYRDHSYFMNILKNYDREPNKEHLPHLLLSMITLQPPLRTSFYTSVKFLTNIKDNNFTDNYLFFDNKECYYIVNTDKISKKRGTDIIYIVNNDLINLLKYSYYQNKRTYIFEKDGVQATQADILRYLRAITKVKGINMDIMRSSYITHYYKNKSYGEKNNIAHDMRHTQATGSKNYFKLIEDDRENDINDISILKNKIKILELEKEEAAKKDISNDKKKRNDIIYKINLKGVTPKPSTLLKYNITLDDNNKAY